MKKLTADEFAAKVMSTGTELEVDELRTQSLRKYDREWSEEEIPDDEQTVVLDIYATSTCTMGMSRLKISAHPITC